MKKVLEGIAAAASKAAGVPVTASDVKPSPVADYATPIAFALAKKLKKNPAEVAKEIAAKIKKPDFAEKVSAEGGFVNFTLDYAKIAGGVLSEARKQDYGGGFAKKEKIILEHTSVNPSGPVHVGRLRNSIIGDSIRRILSHAGYWVETRYYVNNIGKQIAIIALGLSDGIKGDSAIMEKYAKYKSKDYFKVFFTYVEANKKFEVDEGFQKKVQELIHAAENGDKKSLDTITRAADLCLAGQRETYNRLGFKFNAFDYESDEITSGRVFKVLEKLKKSGNWVEKDDVGGGLDLTEHGIDKKTGFTVLARADDTTVYTARDLSYHLQKLSRGDRLINVLGEDHKLQAQELSIILKNFLGVKKPIEVVHYSFVSFEGAKLSTRRGDTAPVDELLDEAIAKASEEVGKRKIAGEKAAEMIGVGAVKYTS